MISAKREITKRVIIYPRLSLSSLPSSFSFERNGKTKQKGRQREYEWTIENGEKEGGGEG